MMIKRFKAAAAVMTGRAEATEPGTGAALAMLGDAQVQELEQKLQQALAENARLKSRGDGFFTVIESVVNQRQIWVDMWREQSSGHLAAQNLMENHIMSLRVMIARVIDMVNQYRDRDGAPRLETPADLDAASPPVGTAKAYEASLAASLVTPPVQSREGVSIDRQRAMEGLPVEVRPNEWSQPLPLIDAAAERDRIEKTT